MKRRLIVSLALIGLAACGKQAPPPPEPSLVFDSRVIYVEADGKTPREGPRDPQRIWAPMLVGDMYGSPNEGEPVHMELKADRTFRLDLNGADRTIEKGLVPTQFSQKWMAIEPAEARIARLIPFVVEADGIAPAGTAEWLDLESGAKLILLYVDRPARIRGDIVFEERRLQFEIDAARAGFLWIRQPEGNGTFRAAPPPAPGKLVLAVYP
jgi:hypothetical protein